MSSPSASRIAQALAQAQAMGGQPGEPGLQSPPGQQILQNLATVAGGYGMGSMGGNIASALAQKGLPALQGMGEAGAIFPEGGPLPSITTKAMKDEIDAVLPDSQSMYLQNLNRANWHASHGNFPEVLKDKWALLRHYTGGN